MPIANLMQTSMKKTGILMKCMDEEKWRPGVRVEDTKVTLRLGDGSSAEYPRDRTQPQIIPLFCPTGVFEIHIKPTRMGSDSNEGEPQVFLPTKTNGPAPLWVDDSYVIRRRPDNTLVKYPRRSSQQEIIPAMNTFLGPMMFEIPPSKSQRKGEGGSSADQKRKGTAKRLPYGLKQKAIARNLKNPQDQIYKQSRSTSVCSDDSGFNDSASIVSDASSTLEEETTISNQPQVDHDNNHFLQHSLNVYLIYFKSVEKKVLETLGATAPQKLGKKGLEDLEDLKNELQLFLEKLERFWHEEEAVITNIRYNSQFQEILSCVTNLQGIFVQLDESEISELLRTTSLNTHEHTLCSILGLTDEVADALLALDPDTRGHQTDEQWIQDYLKQTGEDISTYEDNENVFRSLGFTPIKSKLLAELLEKNLYAGHLTISQWARQHISHEFKYNILLAGHTRESSVTTPYNEHGEYDKEFVVSTEDGQNVKAIDTWMYEEGIGEVDLFADYLKQPKDSLSEAEFLFHGTDHASALNIARQGIDLERSEPGKDFSDGYGFYLSTDMEKAHEWPMRRALAKKRGSSTAVLVFKASKDLFEESNGRVFPDANDDWKSVVTFFRKRKGHYESPVKFTKDQRNQYKKLKFIFGPMSGDGLQVSFSFVQKDRFLNFLLSGKAARMDAVPNFAAQVPAVHQR